MRKYYKVVETQTPAGFTECKLEGIVKAETPPEDRVKSCGEIIEWTHYTPLYRIAKSMVDNY